MNTIVMCCKVLPDGRVITGSNYDKIFKIWNIQTKNCELILKGHTDYISCCYVLQDWRIVTGSADKTLKIWS